MIEEGQEAVGSAVYDLAKGEEAHMVTRAADLKSVVVSSAASQLTPSLLNTLRVPSPPPLSISVVGDAAWGGQCLTCKTTFLAIKDQASELGRVTKDGMGKDTSLTLKGWWKWM